MKILAPFSLYRDLGCHFGCHLKWAGADGILAAIRLLRSSVGNDQTFDCCQQTGIDSRVSLCGINASARSR